MSEQNPINQFAAQQLKDALTSLDTTVYDRITANSYRKQQSLDEASRRKVESLKKLDQTVEARNSLAGALAGFGMDSDISREFVEGTSSGIGSTLGGVGEFIDGLTTSAIEAIPYAKDLNNFFHEQTPNIPTAGDLIQSLESGWQDASEAINQQQLPEFQYNVSQATPEGDLFDPSTWTTRGEVTAEGVVGHLANMVGQFTPQALAMVLTRGQSAATQAGTTAIVGGAQAGGSASSEIEAQLEPLNEAQMAEASKYYRDLRDQNLTHEQAKKQVIAVAGSAAFAGAAPIGALGGAATAYVLGPMKNVLSKNLATRTAERIGISGLEEGVQEVAEGVAARALTNKEIGGNQDLTEGTFGDFVLGAGLGSAIGAPSSIKDAIDTAAEAGKPAAKEIADKTINKNKVATDEIVKKARETGDVSELLDVTKKTYNPTKAAGVLYRRAIDEAEPEAAEQAQLQLKELAQDFQFEVQLLKEDIAKSEGNERQQKALKSELKQVQETLETVQRYTAKAVEKSVENVDVDQVVTDVVTNKDKAADDLITLMMSDSSRVEPEQIESILTDRSVELSEPQRNYLRAYSEAQTQQNRLKGVSGVSKDIYEGGEGYKGLFQYQRGFEQSIKSGNFSKAQSELSGLESFAASRQEKLSAIREAQQIAKETGRSQQIVFDHQQGWTLAEERYSDKELEKNAGLTIHAKPGELLRKITQETNALNATLAQMQAAMALQNVPEKAAATPQEQPTQANFNETPQNETDTSFDLPDIDGSSTSNASDAVSNSGTTLEEPNVSGSKTFTQQWQDSKEVERDKPTRDQDRLRAYFTPVQGKDSDKSSRPLNQAPNFLSQWEQTPKTINRFLDSGLTDKQSSHLELFQTKAKEWVTEINANLKIKREDFRFQDPVQFFIKDGKQLPENVTTAISYAAFNYLAENGLGSPYNTKDAVNRILGRDSNSKLTATQRVLHTAGTRQALVAQSLGKAAFQALGLKADPDAPLNEVARLENSLGNHALGLLLQQGLVERTEVSNSVFANENTRSKEATTPFIRISRNWNGSVAGELNTDVNQIAQSAKDTGGILSKLFKAEPGIRTPSFEPINKVQTKAKNSDQKVSSLQRKILDDEGKKAHYLKQDMVELYKAFSTETLGQIAGIKPVLNTTQASKQLGLRAKNESLVRELNYMTDFINEVEGKDSSLNQPFYFPRSVWKMYRVGLDTNSINPQTSKIHRHMISMGGWESTIKFDNSDKSLDHFMLAVGEAMGVKTDKQTNEVSLNQTKEKLEDSTIREGINSLKLFKSQGTLSQELEASIAKAVSEMGENFHSLDGLSAYADYELAKESDQSEFKTKIMREVDGVTNGPMFTLLQMAAAPTNEALKKLLKKGGFFTDSDTQQNFSAWKSQEGSSDLYESLAYVVHQAMRNQYSQNSELRKPIRATRYFLGEFVEPGTESVTKDGRNAVKTPLTGFAFGSSTTTATSNMAGDIIDSFYDKLENSPSDIEQTIKAINIFIEAGNGQTLDPNITSNEALGLQLTSQQEKAIERGFTETTGSIVKESLEAMFVDLIDLRNLLNKSAKVSFELYNTAYKALRAKTVEDMRKSGELSEESKQDLSKAQEQEIKDQLKALQPVVHTPFSKASKQIDAGYGMYKTETTLDTDTSYRADTPFARNINPRGKALKSLKTQGAQTSLKDPGVATVIGLIHSFDSTVSSLAYSERAALNVHDAHGLGLSDVESGAKALNQHTYQTMIEYSVPVEISESLRKGIKAFAEFAKANPELESSLKTGLTEIREDLTNSLVKQYPEIKTAKDPIMQFNSLLQKEAGAARKQQLEVLKDMTSVDQYALENGNYQTTSKEKAKIEKYLEQLKAYPSKPEITTEVAESPWGKVGNPRIESDAELTRFIKNTENLTVGKLMPVLAQRLRSTQSGRVLQFNLRLLKKLGEQVNLKTPVNLITTATPESELSASVSEARAWYHLGTDGASLNVKSTEFVESAITPETLLHELTHAAVAKAVANPTKATQPLIDELNQLLSTSQEVVNSDPNLSKYRNAVSDVQELIAWGMTNEGFQRQVLNKVEMNSSTTDNVFVSGMRKFIDLVTGILFKGSNKSEQARMQSGMAILIQNTSGLFAANQQNETELLLKQEDVNETLRYTTQQVFDSLSDSEKASNPTHTERLRNILDRVVDKLHGPYGAFTVQAEANTTYTVEESYLKDAANRKSPFTSKAIGFLNLKSHEAFVLEQVELSMREIVGSSHTTYNDLRQLFKEARFAMKGDPRLSQEAYDFIFKAKATDENVSDYVSRFAAVALTYAPLYEALQDLKTQTNHKNLRDMKLGEAIKTLFDRGLNLLNKRLNHVYEGQYADEKLASLVQNLVDLESKQKGEIAYRKNTTLEAMEKTIADLTDKSRGVVDKVGKSDLVQKSPVKMLKAVGTVASAVAGDRAHKILDAIEEVSNKNAKGRQGFFASLLTEAKGATDDNQRFHELLREANKLEQERKHLIDETSELVKSQFKNEGNDLTKEQWQSLTRTFIRTDLSSLMQHFSMSDIANLVLDPSELEKQLQVFESELSGRNQHYYQTSAKDLGYFLATGISVGDNLMLNAHNIAYMANTRRRLQGNDPTAETNLPIIDALVSLYAVKYLPEDVKDMAAEVLKTETQKDGESGIELILKLHKGLQEKARKTLFSDGETHFMKGYTKEIYDPRISLVIADPDQTQKLEALGYSPGAMLDQDPADTSDGRQMFINKNAGLRSHVTGTFSYTGKRAKGSKLHSGLTNVLHTGISPRNHQLNQSVSLRIDQRVEKMFQPQPSYNPSKRSQARLVPVLNHQGDAVNYRYMMREEIKDSLLNRDNQVDVVLGALAGSIYDKAEAETQNKKVVEALYEQYELDYPDKPDSYILVSPDSDDKAIRETYHLLPDNTKKAIKQIWGKDEMWVRRDLYDLNFGYRKYSLSEMFDKDPKERYVMENIATWLFEKLFKKKAALRIMRAEDWIQESVRMTKDILVIKNIVTLLGNISSNVSLLLWMGVPPGKIIDSHKTAIKGFLSYQRDRKELSKLQRLLEIDAVQPSDIAEIEQQIVELKDAIERNPIKGLVDAGLFQTIVEDVDNHDDRFSFTTHMQDEISKRVPLTLPDDLKTVGKTLFMTHDTPVYKLLNQATSMSDFVARYTLYEHVTTRKNEQLGHDDAIQLAVDAFVNYDIPTHQKLQYLNDMGLVLFTKYYIRIQKVILRLYRDKPGRTLALLALEAMMPQLATLMDSAFWTRLDNPFTTSAYKLFETVDEIATLKAALSPFE